MHLMLSVVLLAQWFLIMPNYGVKIWFGRIHWTNLVKVRGFIQVSVRQMRY